MPAATVTRQSTKRSHPGRLDNRDHLNPLVPLDWPRQRVTAETRKRTRRKIMLVIIAVILAMMTAVMIAAIMSDVLAGT